jgi:eukaryotic-like serine/threonine-protein kinase
MELIDGTTVHEWIATAKPTVDEVLDVFETAGRGLAAAHAAGLVHRDFKPHNVLRSKRGRVVVTDFGLARAALDEPDIVATVPGGGPPKDAMRPVDSGSLSSTLTATGALLGTPAYMAPEQHDGAAVGPAADQFAYCVALWEALAGARPFPGQTLASVRQQIAKGPDAETEAKVPRRLRAVLRKGLATEPDARFPTMDALLAAIRRKRAGRAWAIAAGAAVVIAGAVLWFVLAGSRSAPAALPGCGDPDAELAAFTTSPARAKLTSDEARRPLATLDREAKEWAAVHRDRLD